VSPVVKMIWAQSSNRAIGKDNEIPWRIKEDFQYFKNMTDGCTVIMGKNTWLSLPEKSRPLPGRRNIVLSRNPDSFEHDGAECFPTLEDALATHPDKEVVWVIGGAGVYASAMPLASEIHVTYVSIHVKDADTFMPPLSPEEFRIATSSEPATSQNGIRYWMTVYKRR
jgi:dihydrofolate reductase